MKPPFKHKTAKQKRYKKYRKFLEEHPDLDYTPDDMEAIYGDMKYHEKVDDERKRDDG